ncbi:hypothetical protein [Photobacterium atrarenae]|uniref:Dethiobiotin synthetase n=1 Tax=Photobacterium atrarenae TaxID=865757 RepID=A0ABY5GHM3_9GAMM|nr:hypothetical protein [Photobacterium atrarenae]UTV28777.1 hypothetical protein NNL38_05900 [Photobacterium atrarenae]
MADNQNYQVAIDILRCHLGMTTDEAHRELGIDAASKASLSDAHDALLGLTQEG